MADSPSGGSNWGPFEVILGLVLAIGLISSFNNKNKIDTSVPQKKEEAVVKMDDSAARCGLSITNPISLERVSTSIRLAGSINGCNWNPDGETVLFAQVVNSKGVPISDFITVQNNGASFLFPSFDTSIYITEVSKAETGYLILIPAIQQPEKEITVRIPIRLVQN